MPTESIYEAMSLRKEGAALTLAAPYGKRFVVSDPSALCSPGHACPGSSLDLDQISGMTMSTAMAVKPADRRHDTTIFLLISYGRSRHLD